jgi:catechol 2,3-dioxygenase-like lactoylglutathione lyase family enzyme
LRWARAAVHRPPTPSPPASPAGTPATPPPAFLGLEHLALSVTDMDAAVADLTAKGATLARPVSSPRPGIRICFVNAPNGAQVELVERG